MLTQESSFWWHVRIAHNTKKLRDLSKIIWWICLCRNWNPRPPFITSLCSSHSPLLPLTLWGSFCRKMTPINSAVSQWELAKCSRWYLSWLEYRANRPTLWFIKQASVSPASSPHHFLNGTYLSSHKTVLTPRP